MTTALALSAELVRGLLDYHPKTGQLFWKPRPVQPGMERNDKTWNSRFAGTAAGYPHPRGMQIGINGRLYPFARIVWLHYYGEWPRLFVDHIDTNNANNRIDNLRLATNSENLRNRGPQANNTSGYKGVCYDKARKKWMASIYADGKHITIGRYATAEEAAHAYREAASRLHGEFAHA